MIGQAWVTNCPEEMISLGWIPCDITPEPTTGTGGFLDLDITSKLQTQLLREDEEVVAMIMAFMRIVD